MAVQGTDAWDDDDLADEAPQALRHPGGPTAPALPVPGRHVARRPPSLSPSDLVPAPLRGGVRLGAAQLAAVAVLVAAGLAVTCWWVVRGDPATPVPVAMEQVVGGRPGAPVGTAADPTSPAGSEPGPAPQGAPGEGGDQGAASGAGVEVTVDVAGRVRRPGIVVLDAGARVVDALEQAGGARDGVDLTSLNLARVLVDGEQIVVGPGAPAAGAPVPAVPPSGTAAPTALVDLNLADQALLETLPQVGPVTASAIIAWRTEHGAFTSVTELLEVDGIGDATLAQVTPFVTV